jgi:hypothetical protein
MPKARMKDMVILLPGITGSVLCRGEDEIWADSLAGYFGAVSTKGKSLQKLVLHDSEGDDDIKATRLISGGQIIPGLIKVDGYAGISTMIKDNFEVVTCGNSPDDAVCNYCEFAYDWRRDIRVAARALAQLVENRLHAWRKFVRSKEPKTILLAHSMGGLISQYYLEVLEGWRDCRTLITFGAPLQGSLNALNYLANGYKHLVFDLTQVMRSCTSVYQLLPTYEVIRTLAGYRAVADPGELPGVESSRMLAALDYHQQIRESHKANGKLEDYQVRGYSHVAVIGTSQATLQSAVLHPDRLDVTHDRPEWLDALLADGDGTVPRYSAIAQLQPPTFGSVFVADRHSAIQNNPFILNELRERLRQLQATGIAPIRGAANTETTTMNGITLDVNDQYERGKAVTISAFVADAVTSLTAHISNLDDPTAHESAYPMSPADRQNGGFISTELLSGRYRVRVTASGGGKRLAPVSDIFEVV